MARLIFHVEGVTEERFVNDVLAEHLLTHGWERVAARRMGISRPDLAGPFQTIRNGFGSPEEIDDSPETAPSKRIAALMADYNKPVMGIAAALEIGLDAMRRACPHFHSWLELLESWPH